MTLLNMLAHCMRPAGLAAVIAGVAFSAAPSRAEGLAPGEYQIGFVTENTGPLAAAGVSYYHGAQLAIDEINQSAWIGKGDTLKMVEKESGSDAARAVQ